MLAAYLSHQRGDQPGAGSATDPCRIADRIVNPALTVASVHGRSLGGVVRPSVPLTPADGVTALGDHPHRRGRASLPADSLAVLGDLLLGSSVRRPPAGHVRQAGAGPDSPAV